ncbi:MAG: xanthine dehydrogenase family protein molybdopterin-binding subunit [Gammaproteobacteria bacterium]|jgi:isoquinoline 1-oxidoreductase beta subunit
MERLPVTRRGFLRISTALGGGLLIGVQLGGLARQAVAEAPPDAEAGNDVFQPNVWLTIAPDDGINIQVASSEMGQGVMTALPMLIAEELDADWGRVRAEFAPVNPAYANPIFGRQQTGGSTAVRGYWRALREAGAAGREVLIRAAARRWSVPTGRCTTESSQVIDTETGRRLRYGELVGEAAGLPVPDMVFLKEPEDFRLLGRATPRLDLPDKVDGSAQFGIDVKLPGLLTATVLRCPVFGGRVKTIDDTDARAVAGVRRVVSISTGVAVLADHFWAARQGRAALKVQWDTGPAAQLDSATIRARMKGRVDGGTVGRDDGDAERALGNAGRRLEAVYEVPYLAHACMEPMNCTAHVRSDGCDIWVPTQGQTRTHDTAVRLTGLPPDKVRVHTTYLGGGFGRRSEQDFVIDAVEASREAGAPVKVIWTREDDIRHDYYRPATYNRLAAALDAQGMPVAWQHRIAGPSIAQRDSLEPETSGEDFSATEGALKLPYAIPNIRVTYARVNTAVPVGYWRSVASSQNAFITECFLDEVAAAGGKDPYELRRTLLASQPRLRGVLDLAADKAGWEKPTAEGRFRGIAVAESFGSYVAQVAEVSVEEDRPRVHRVVCAIDCGMIVNPDTIVAQMESGIVYGLTAALKGEITIDSGRVVQGNFDDYPLLRLEECPDIEVHIVPSGEAPGGVGEPGTPPIAPAVANAVFAATGNPVRRLPIRL